MSTMKSDGTIAELSPRQQYSASIDIFKTQGAYLILCTETISNTKMKVVWEAVSGDGKTTYKGSHEFDRDSTEITSENAKVTIKNDVNEYSKVTVWVGRDT